jgi:glycosyltransferase involved in cell wall biosynthesis
MAAGLPVVATRTEGSLELLQRKDLLVPFGDPVRLANRMASLLKDARSRSSLSEELTQRARENYSLDKMVDLLEHLYQQVLNPE